MDVVVARPGRFRRTPKADVHLYHVGNDPVEHGWIVEALERRNGVVVLHEFVLHHLVSGITLARGDVEGYCAALEREAGAEGRDLGLAVQQGRIEPLWETRAQEFPLAHGVLDAATGLIVHSQYVEGLARDAGYAGPIRQVPMPAWPVPPIVAGADRRQPGDRLLRTCEREQAHPPALLGVRAVARTPTRSTSAARRLVVTEAATDPDSAERRPHGLRPRGRALALLAACDAVVSLRWPTMGETSAAAVRALSVGKPLIVSDVGAFRELPDEVAIKVPVGDGEIEALASAMERAAGNEAMGGPRWRVAATKHDVDRTADLYAAALRLAVTGSSGRCLPHEGRLLLAHAAVPLGDRRLLGAAPAGAGEADRRRPRAARAVPARPAGRHRACTTSATTPRRTAGSSRRSVERPGVVVLHDFVLHHLVVGLTFARGDAAGYLAAMEREDGLVGRLLAYAVLDNKLPPLWETRPEDFPLAGEVLDHATGLIVHSHYVERRARESGFRGPIARIPHPAWPLPEIEPAAVGRATRCTAASAT